MAGRNAKGRIDGRLSTFAVLLTFLGAALLLDACGPGAAGEPGDRDHGGRGRAADHRRQRLSGDDLHPLLPVPRHQHRPGLDNANDNCPDVANPGQTDVDDDGRGDACDDSEVPHLQGGGCGCAAGPGLAGGNAPHFGFSLLITGLVLLSIVRRRERA